MSLSINNSLFTSVSIDGNIISNPVLNESISNLKSGFNDNIFFKIITSYNRFRDDFDGIYGTVAAYNKQGLLCEYDIASEDFFWE